MTIEMVIEEIARISKEERVKRVLLFGSRAKGTARERSDIDIAVEGAEDFEAFCEKIDDIDTLYTIDIVNLNTCKNGLLMEDIETYGRKIFETV